MTNLLGWLLIKLFRCKDQGGYWLTKNEHDWGVSLGKYIICGSYPSVKTLKHERGHQLQYLRHPHLYLLIVGIPSICRNIYARVMKKDSKWYYSGYPEKQADELGGVQR